MKNKNNILEEDSYELNYYVDPSKNCQKYIKSYDDKKFTKYKYSDSVVKGDYVQCLISILFNTNSIDKTKFSVKKFIEKAKNSENIQICIKIDNDDSAFVKKFLKSLENYKCNFIILASPQGRGYIDLWHWINFLYKVSSKKADFIINTSDEMYVDENNWDLKLSNYKNSYSDNIFRLRTSVYKNRNYHNLWECGYAPDTTAIYTKKYLQIQGNFSPCFGPDNGQQFVAYYLSKLNYPRHYQFSRDIVINDISFKGQGTNADMEGSSLRIRQVINYLLWNNMFKHKYQEDYFKRARKIQLEIILCQMQSSNKISILENKKKKEFQLYVQDVDKNRKILKLQYKINKWTHYLYLISKLDFFKNHTSSNNSKYMGICVHFLMQHMKIHPELVLYKKKYDFYTLYEIKKSIEINVKRLSLKYIFFTCALFLSSIYFYISNFIKIQTINFLIKWAKLSENILSKSLLVKKKIPYFFIKFETSKRNFITEKNNNTKKSRYIYFKKTYIYNTTNFFYKFTRSLISVPLEIISSSIYNFLFFASNKFKPFIILYITFKFFYNIFKNFIIFIDIIYYLLIDFILEFLKIIYNLVNIFFINIHSIENNTSIINFILFYIMAPYNIIIYIFNIYYIIQNYRDTYLLNYFVGKRKEYKLTSVATLTNPKLVDQSQVIIISGDKK